MGGPWPCMDENRRYKSFPCSQCKSETCIFGKKPAGKKLITLAIGQKACDVCGTAYQAYGKSKYCSDDCRRKAIAKQRRKRRNKLSDMIY